MRVRGVTARAAAQALTSARAQVGQRLLRGGSLESRVLRGGSLARVFTPGDVASAVQFDLYGQNLTRCPWAAAAHAICTGCGLRGQRFDRARIYTQIPGLSMHPA